MVKAVTVRNLDRTDGSISMVLSFQVDEFQAIRRGMYTAILTSEGAPHGETGDPALPWRKLLVCVPDGASAVQAKFKVTRSTQWLSGVLIEPIQPDVPISESEMVKPVGPNTGVYGQTDIWPKQPGHAVVVRRLGKKQMLEIRVCPVQYHPADRRVDVVQELLIEISFQDSVSPARGHRSPAEARFEQRTLQRVKARVLNPEHVDARLASDVVLLDAGGLQAVPYVVVTSRALAPSFERLTQWRSLLGQCARVVAVEDIQANAVQDTGNAAFWLPAGYADGGTRDLAEAIRNFIKWAQVNWQTEYVLLGGDTGVVPARHGWIPLDHMVYGNVNSPDMGTNIAMTASASSSAPGTVPGNVLDDDTSTSWSCASTDSAPWIAVMLPYLGAGLAAPVNHVQLVWGATAAASYIVQVTHDYATWTDVHSTVSGAGGVEDIAFACTSAAALRLLVQSGPGFTLSTFKAFGPSRNNTAYALSSTCTRVCVNFAIAPNPGNNPDLDRLLILDGPQAGRVVPYNASADDTNLGWRFVSDVTTTPATVQSRSTPFLEIRGPAEFHGHTMAAKTGKTYIATDLYYGDLDSPNPASHDWDADGNGVYGERYANQIDTVNGLSDVYVGRVSVTTDIQAEAVVSKIIHYEQYRDAGGFEPLLPTGFGASALLAARNWYDPGPGYLDGSAACNEDIRRMLMDSGTPWTFTRLYEDTADVAAADVTPDLAAASKETIKAAIAAGHNLVSLVSHGSPAGLCYLGTADVDDEVHTPSVWYGNACTTNKFDDVTFSETSLLNARGGAVAYIGNSRFGWTSDGPMEVAFWEEMLDSGRLGPMLERAHLIGGDWQKYSLNLQGDPAMRVWSGTPRLVTVTHALHVYVGSNMPFDVSVRSDGTAVVGATVCVSMAGAYVASAVSDAGGVARLRTSIAAVGMAQVAVSGMNLVPYVANIAVKEGQAGIVVAPDRLAFGRVAVGSIVTKTITISSTGTATLVFSIDSPPQGSPFHWRAVSGVRLAPASTYRYEIALAPTARGACAGALAITSNATGRALTVPLSGTAEAQVPCVEGNERYERCWANGRSGYRRLVCSHGRWVAGPCMPGQIP